MEPDNTSNPEYYHDRELQSRPSSLARRKFESDGIPLLDRLKARDPRAHSKYIDTTFGKLDNTSQDDIIFLLKHAPPTHESPSQAEANETRHEADIFRIQTDNFQLQPEKAFLSKFIARLANNMMTLRELALIGLAVLVGHFIWTRFPIWIALEVYEAFDCQFQLLASLQRFQISHITLAIILYFIQGGIIGFMVHFLFIINKKFQRYCHFWVYFVYSPRNTRVFCPRCTGVYGPCYTGVYFRIAKVEQFHEIYSLWSSLYPELAGLPAFEWGFEHNTSNLVNIIGNIYRYTDSIALIPLVLLIGHICNYLDIYGILLLAAWTSSPLVCLASIVPLHLMRISEQPTYKTFFWNKYTSYLIVIRAARAIITYLVRQNPKFIFKYWTREVELKLDRLIIHLVQNDLSKDVLSLLLIVYLVLALRQKKGKLKPIHRRGVKTSKRLDNSFEENKKKRGVKGFINGIEVVAIADTGAAQNVISLEYVKRMHLSVAPKTYRFKLGNCKTISSLGIVEVEWTFEASPSKTVKVTCHVLQSCIYDIILGNDFLNRTNMLLDYRANLTQCIFSVPHAIQFGFLGGTSRRIEGTLGSQKNVLALPDSGAERNVIDFRYAHKLGLEIDRRSQARNYLQFADGSCQQTSGQVHTRWTFANGKSVPVTFEVLRGCAADVVIGEQLIYETNLFADHTESMKTIETKPAAPFELAPFDFVNGFEKRFEKVKRFICFERKDVTLESVEKKGYKAEIRRREEWNLETDFGLKVDETDRQLEKMRRQKFDEGARHR